MIKEKKPEKIILDFTYIEDVAYILDQIKATGIPCVNQKDRDNQAEVLVHDVSQHPGDVTCQEPFLYITDDGIKAAEYKAEGKAVLVFLHEKNKGESFPKNRYFIEGFEDADATYFTRIYQREKKIPWTIGVTERLKIREMTLEDTDALYSLYQDKAVVEFMEDLPQNKEEEKAYITDYIDKVYGFLGFGMWLAELRETGEVIGRVGFRNCEAETNSHCSANESEDGNEPAGAESASVELGFMISPKYQSHGYAYEACRAAIDYMQEEYPEYKRIARCMRGNVKAIKLCHKLGIECRLF